MRFLSISLCIFFSLMLITIGSQARDVPNIPAPPYTIFGNVFVNGTQLGSPDRNYTISAKINDNVVSSYLMGSDKRLNNNYVLTIPTTVRGSIHSNSGATDKIYVYVNDVMINKAMLKPEYREVELPIGIGNPGETRCIDIYVSIDISPPYVENLNPKPGSLAVCNTTIYLELKEISLVWTSLRL